MEGLGAGWAMGCSSASVTRSRRASAASKAAVAETPGFGRTGVTAVISSFTASNTTMMVGG